jgi:hypothetical protein
LFLRQARKFSAEVMVDVARLSVIFHSG